MNPWRTRALIDLDAIRSNIDRVRQFAVGSKIMAVIKSNAYGHGATTVATALVEQVDAFAVATIDEGVALRRTAIKSPIIVFSGFWSAAQIDHFNTFSLTPVIHHNQQLDWLEVANKLPAQVWLKINTGMNRLGFEVNDVAAAVRRLEAVPNLNIAGLMSHLANADNLDDPLTHVQTQKFGQATVAFDYPRSLANSAGIVSWPDTHFDWVRPGIMLYGAPPILNHEASDLGLSAVMQLESRLISIHSLKSGSAVGYGGRWRCQGKAKLGIVSIGYGDGYPRCIDHQSYAVVAGEKCPIVGQVSMDSLALNLSNCAQASLGDSVTLWGKVHPIEQVAASATTISYELFCRLTSRVHRQVVSHGSY